MVLKIYQSLHIMVFIIAVQSHWRLAPAEHVFRCCRWLQTACFATVQAASTGGKPEPSHTWKSTEAGKLEREWVWWGGVEQSKGRANWVQKGVGLAAAAAHIKPNHLPGPDLPGQSNMDLCQLLRKCRTKLLYRSFWANSQKSPMKCSTIEAALTMLHHHAGIYCR